MRKRRVVMKRRDFFKTVGLPVAAAVGAVFASGIREPARAGKKFNRGNSGGNSGGNKKSNSSGNDNNSGLSGMDLGSGRLKMDHDGKSDQGFIVYDDLSK
jgi:hypothetical protein